MLLGVAVAASVGLLLGRNAGTAPDFSRSGPANPVQAAQAARVQAATWVAGQVSRSAIVSCDPVMCSALQARGFPASDLDPLGPSAPDPLDSSLVVATSVLRSQFGSRLGTVYAPVVLASFGTGSAAIQVRAVAPGGASAYLRQLNADFTARKAVGSQLLRNPNVVAGPAARRQLELGQVDARLITTIGTMAHSYAVRILAFGDAAPGAAAEVPLRSASLGSLASGTAATAVLNSVRSFLEAQQSPYLPAVTRIMRLATGQMAVNVQFAAPDPLGLLDAGPAVVNIGSPG